MNTNNLEGTEESTPMYRPLAAVAGAAETGPIRTEEPPTDAEIAVAIQKVTACARRGAARRVWRQMMHGDKEDAQDGRHVLEMEFHEVLALMRTEGEQRARNQKRMVGVVLGIVLLYLLLAFVSHKPSIVASFGGYTALIAGAAAATRRQKAAALAAARFDDIRVVGPLAEALEFNQRDVADIAAKRLICLLPRLKASDAGLLSERQRACLNRALRGRNTRLILAILKGYEQVGDSSALGTVETLSSGRWRAGRVEEVAAAARECLPALRQSAERRQTGLELLRASASGEMPSDALLRAAMPGVSAAPACDLLRPQGAEEAPPLV